MAGPGPAVHVSGPKTAVRLLGVACGQSATAAPFLLSTAEARVLPSVLSGLGIAGGAYLARFPARTACSPRDRAALASPSRAPR